MTSDEVSARVAQAEATERDIDATRELYRPVAAHASLLFFAISELAAVEPMYQYSLAWFMRLFVRTMEEAPKVGGAANVHLLRLLHAAPACLPAGPVQLVG